MQYSWSYAQQANIKAIDCVAAHEKKLLNINHDHESDLPLDRPASNLARGPPGCQIACRLPVGLQLTYMPLPFNVLSAQFYEAGMGQGGGERWGPGAAMRALLNLISDRLIAWQK